MSASTTNGAATALGHLRICDFTGQLAGAGSTKWMAAFGAEVIRIEDPVAQGRWDLLRGLPPFVDARRGNELGGGYNNHNVGKLGITLNLRTPRAKELLSELISVSDVVTENFAAGVLERMGFGWSELQSIKPDIIYVSNCGFGHQGPYRTFKTWGPIVQACCGLSFSSGLAGHEPAGYGFSFMDHHGASFMAIAILSGVLHRNRTGEGQWIDMSCTDAGATMIGPAVLDGTVNGRLLRRDGSPNSNRSQHPAMAPHGIFRCRDTPGGPAIGDPTGDDNWVAFACRSESDWSIIASMMNITDSRFADVAGRLAFEDELEAVITRWTRERDRIDVAALLSAAGVPASIVARPIDRIDNDLNTAEWGLWPTVEHLEMGRVRVDGLPVHLSKTDWSMTDGAPLLGEDNERVFGTILGLTSTEIAALRTDGVI